MATRGTVRSWIDEEGWGVIDSVDTPGGCWAHFSQLAMPGDHTLQVGQLVELEWKPANQDGYAYRAVRVWPEGHEPDEMTLIAEPSAAYRSNVTLTWPEDPTT